MKLEEIADLLQLLRERGESVATAESLTGGGLGVALTAVAGSSKVYWGGVIAYQSVIKESVLQVPAPLLAEFGAISGEVVTAMARGVRQIFGTTWAIATSGVAGPGPAEGYPPGFVWVAILGPQSHIYHMQLEGEREVVRNATITSALGEFARILRTTAH